MEKSVKRKLSSIFSADVRGYSRLMGNDDIATLPTLEKHHAMMDEFS